jgi:hypothetical protein
VPVPASEGAGISLERHYFYHDEDGDGTMVMQDGPKYSWGRPISVVIYQKGHTFFGKGWRSLTSEETHWFANCEFWVSGGGLSAKYVGHVFVKPPLYSDGVGYGAYYKGSGSPYDWKCKLDID